MGGIIRRFNSPSQLDPELYDTLGNNSLKSSLQKWTHGDIWSVYKKVKVLGDGMSGTVYEIQNKETGARYACKGVTNAILRPDLIADMKLEVEMLKTLDHPNVIRLHEMWQTKQAYYMVLELAEGEDLHTNLNKRRFFGEYTARRIFADALKAVRYVHTRGVAHRDIKLANFVFVPQESDGNAGKAPDRLKLIDFGLSSEFYARPKKEMNTLCGTVYFIAPEVTTYETYTHKCDMWALGVVLYMLLSGQAPFNGRTDEEILKRVCEGDFEFTAFQWGIISKEAKDLVKKLLTVNPEKRLSAQEASEHPWLKSVSSTKISKENLAQVAQTMNEFSDLGLLRQTALDLMVLQEPMKHLEKLSATFLALDTHGNGTITQEEFVNALESLDHAAGPKTLDPILLFSKLDRDRTGVICYSEFLAATVKNNIEMTEARMQKAFNKLDADSSGSITGKNLKTFAYIRQKYTEEEITAMIKELDLSHSGGVSFREFKHAMSTMGSKTMESKIALLPKE